ncbi:cell division cycle-associated protein 7-like isoform X3 [Gouania willdenowi]|uniref:cell division cycle-associated protein 7-like isoform X3 n=1 Tax=Gouania willdenowi TaxID=441366 RepID=UPI0010568DB2|nr:cell division cycle-associated protein 7-like isoform X3 [Gouania willdenowi]
MHVETWNAAAIFFTSVQCTVVFYSVNNLDNPVNPKRRNTSIFANGLLKALVVGKNFLTQELADVFADDSESDDVFHGFSDTELKNEPFKLRVVLCSKASTQQSTEEDDAEQEEQRIKTKMTKRTNKSKKKKKNKRQMKFEEKETEVTCQAVSEFQFDSTEDVSDVFLVKREQNIRANKAMLAQLMADLHQMPGGAGLLRNKARKQKIKDETSRPPRSAVSRRNPERASRRQTRSMGGVEGPSMFQEEEAQLSLEEELLEVRAPRRRANPRPNHSKPHFIRPVEEITEDELQLVADNMTEKVYNSVTGSTCHQCRQKTVDTKTCCRSEDCRGIQGQFCGPCLRNRYGQDVRKALLDSEWRCPPCRGICNCSFCRQRDGRCPTGILFPLAQYHGFSDVHSYLISLCAKVKSQDAEM